MHEAMLNRHVKECSIGKKRFSGSQCAETSQGFIKSLAYAPTVIFHPSDAWPISRLVGREAAIHGINSEGEELVERGVMRLEACCPAEKVPIERFEMAEVKDQALTFGDRAAVERIRKQQRKQGIRTDTRFIHSTEQGWEKIRRQLKGRHGSPLGWEPVLICVQVPGQRTLLGRLDAEALRRCHEIVRSEK